MTDVVQVTGKSDLLLAYPSTAPLLKIGEAQDVTDFSENPFWHDVPGDRHGGPQGPPIEVQWLGETANISFDLSRWDEQVVAAVRTHNIMPVGSLFQIDLRRVGSLMLKDRSWRLVVRNTILDIAGTPITVGINFPCCLVRRPIGYNRGTKYSAVNLAFEAHRAPEGHPFEGVLYDGNLDQGAPQPPQQ